ncbi:acyl-ACP desaturase [Actinomadura barringtoniae]|uniref:Acyl-ACP desaturase n=1 Tax=Actinomadura barringtoniae TaxID=1427535 RepID=A0A939P653_9ACTN|nr:acyl-ACP desaturase [Actinomadura barringtoniae]MBO2446141.1 acyl-ACP desaturase [Actinomadura barringtoniae]
MSIAPVSKTDLELFMELEPTVEKEVNRHVSMAEEWFPHEYVPYSDGRTYSGVLDGEGWEPGDSKVSPESREALLVNLLTEDNLPGYHFALRSVFGQDGAYGYWTNRWTAEENRHGIVIRDYLTVTRAIDPVVLERARMAHLQVGYAMPHGADMLRGATYVAFQELATRISHRNTGRASGDPLCEQMMARVAKDENLHMIFYRNFIGAAFEASPSQAVKAVADVVTTFEMPGNTIDGFLRKSVQIANAGIYDLRLHHDEVVAPILRKWGVFELTGLDDEAEQARETLATYMAGLDAAATKFEERRAERAARKAARQS